MRKRVEGKTWHRIDCRYTQLIAVIVIGLHLLFPFTNSFAEDTFTVYLNISAQTTIINTGSKPVRIGVMVTGTDLVLKWELQGPGKLEGTGRNIMYIVPASIPETPDTAIITVTVTNKKTGQKVKEFISLTLIQNSVSPHSTTGEEGKGMETWTPVRPHGTTGEESGGTSTRTKVLIGAGTIAALAGGTAIALLSGTDGKSDGSGRQPKSGNWAGQDIAFTVSGDSTSVSNMSIKYGASFDTGRCRGNYTSTITSSGTLPITNNVVGPTTISLSGGGSLTVTGTFTDATHITVNASWQEFIPVCNFLHSGARTYTASR